MDNTRPQVFGAGAGAGFAQGTDSASSGEAGTDSTEGSGAQDGGIPKYRIVAIQWRIRRIIEMRTWGT